MGLLKGAIPRLVQNPPSLPLPGLFGKQHCRPNPPSGTARARGTRLGDLPPLPSQQVVGIGMLIALGIGLQHLLQRMHINFPAAVPGVLLVFLLLCAIEQAAGPHRATSVLLLFAPAVGFLNRWLGLMFVPAMIRIPVSLAHIPGSTFLSIVGLLVPKTALAIAVMGLLSRFVEPKPEILVSPPSSPGIPPTSSLNSLGNDGLSMNQSQLKPPPRPPQLPKVCFSSGLLSKRVVARCWGSNGCGPAACDYRPLMVRRGGLLLTAWHHWGGGGSP